MALASMDLKGEAKRAFETALSLEPRCDTRPVAICTGQGSISSAALHVRHAIPAEDMHICKLFLGRFQAASQRITLWYLPSGLLTCAVQER